MIAAFIPQSEPLFQRLITRTPFSARELATIVATAPNRYKNHWIEKRNGRGKRLISQPTAELKFLQRLLIAHELSDLPVHDAAMAYRRTRSIRNHALPHAGARYLLKMDFRDFFPSLKEGVLRYCFARDTRFSDGEIRILCQLLCRRNNMTGQLQISIGAPSSPFISNYLMWEFDKKLTTYCRARGVVYTRYADDLAFSTSTAHLLDSIHAEVQRLLVELSYLGISLNDNKTVNVSTKHRRTLVGLVLANDGSVSVGRSEKRRLRAEMDALSRGRLSPVRVNRLRGMLAFVYAVDPHFVRTLCAKHGFQSISAIASFKGLQE